MPVIPLIITIEFWQRVRMIIIMYTEALTRELSAESSTIVEILLYDSINITVQT